MWVMTSKRLILKVLYEIERWLAVGDVAISRARRAAALRQYLFGYPQPVCHC
jgi:hypothetical protein